MTAHGVLFDIGDTLWRVPPELFDRGRVLACYETALLLLNGFGEVPPAGALLDAVGERLTLLRTNGGEQPATVKVVADALAAFGVKPPADVVAAFTETVFDRNEVEIAARQPPEPEMASALAALRDRGLALACVSNTFMSGDALRRMLEARGLGGFFAAVVSSADVGYRKPHPAVFQLALAAVSLAPEETVFVGDRLDTDIRGAKALGMAAVLTHQYRQEDPAAAEVKPDAVICHLSDLAEYVDSIGGGRLAHT